MMQIHIAYQARSTSLIQCFNTTYYYHYYLINKKLNPFTFLLFYSILFTI